MKLHNIHEKIILPVPVEKAWDFFSNPHNLALITPPELGLNVGPDVPATIYPGLIISYKIHPLPFIGSLWVTEIKDIINGAQFVDEQRFGPYKFWHHLHRVKPLENGTEVEDIVHYAVPYGPVGGEIIHSLFIKKQLSKIFKFRKAKLDELFPSDLMEKHDN